MDEQDKLYNPIREKIKWELIGREQEDLTVIFGIIKEHYLVENKIILRLLADAYFEEGQHTQCLMACAYYCAEIGESEQLFMVVKAYYAAYMAHYEEDYKKNKALLDRYAWRVGFEVPEYADVEDVLLWQDQDQCLYINRKTTELHLTKKDRTVVGAGPGDVFFIYGINNLDNLSELQSKTKRKELLWMKRPIYVYYKDENDFNKVLQTASINRLLSDENVVLFCAWEACQTFLEDVQCYEVTRAIYGEDVPATEAKLVADHLEKMKQDKQNRWVYLFYENKRWYAENREQIRQNIRERKPRILFFTTRFSTAIQYHTRDAMQACEDMGLSVALGIEKSDVHLMNELLKAEIVYKFKPDVVFVIDYFKAKRIEPDEIIHVTWAQDPMPKFEDKTIPPTLTENDYMLAYAQPIHKLVNTGFNPEKIMMGYVPANEKLYKPYVLTAAEKSKYETDICMVAHGANYEERIQMTKRLFSAPGISSFTKALDEILRLYYQQVFEEKGALDFEEDRKKFIIDYLSEFYPQIKISSETLNLLIREFINIRACSYRSVIAEWLIDGGYTNLKLYGRDWMNNPKFKPYAMGTAPNGEELSKIYQAAKIVLASNNYMTFPTRLSESYLSGAFYLAGYVDPRADHIDVRKVFKEGEELPFFYNRQDLYDKIDYYLKYPDERQKVSRAMREKLLDTMTYGKLMRRMVDWLAQKV